MADAQRTVDLVFNAVDKTGPAVQSALRNTRGLATDIQSATQPFANVTAAALKYEAALLATGAAITAFSVKAAGDFDGAFREIATLIDAPIDALGEFRQGILDYAADSTGSLEEVTTSIYNAISAGVDYTDSLEAVAQAEQLSVAGKGELDSTLKLLVSSLNAYGLEMSEAERFSDALFTTVRVGQTTLPELTESLQQVTGTAATVGVPFEEILAALAALTSAGTPTAQAVTQISSVLTGVLKPSQQAADAAAQLGLEFSAQAVRADGLQGFLQKVAEATGGNEELMAKLFPRVESLRAVFPLTGIAADKFATSLESITNSAGATENAYAKLADSLSNVASSLGSSFEVLLVSIGDPLLDDVNGVAEAIGAIFSTLTDSFNEGELRGITAFIETEFAVLATTLQGIAQALPQALSQADLSGFTDGLTAVRDAISGLLSGLDLTDADDLAEALTFVGESFEGLSRFSGGVIESFQPLFKFFADLAQRASESAEAADSIGKAFGSLTQINLFSGALGGLISPLEAVVGLLIAGQAGSLVSGLKAIGPAALAAAGPITTVTAAISGLQAAYGFFRGESADNLINSIPNIWGGDDFSTQIVDEIEYWKEVLGLVGDEAERIQSPIRDVGKALASVGSSAEGSARPVRYFSGELYDSVQSMLGVEDGASNADQALQYLADRFGIVAVEAGNIGGESIGTLYDLSGALQSAGDAAGQVSQRAIDINEKWRSTDTTFNYVTSGVEKTTTALTDLSKVSDELKVELAIAGLESSTEIAVAGIEASAEKVKAAFQSIDNTVTTTGDSITSLFGLLSDENLSKLDKIDVRKSIEEQEQRQGEALDLQKKLTRAQIDEVQARIAALQRGDALVKVNGDGLAPHLEAIMFELFEAIQVRVNAQGYQYLLGAPP